MGLQRRLFLLRFISISLAIAGVIFIQASHVQAEPVDLSERPPTAKLGAPTQAPRRPSLGAIGQPNQNSGPSSAQQTPNQPLSDRNAAYFNRPGAIPRTSFQPINNSAPTNNNTPNAVQNAAPLTSAPLTSAPLASAPAPVEPPKSQPGLKVKPVQQSKGQTLTRPQPLGAPRQLRERTRPVPGLVIPPKTAKVYPAYGPQPARETNIATPSLQGFVPPNAQSSQGLLPLQAGQFQNDPLTTGQISAQKGAVQREVAGSRAAPARFGTLPTVAPRPKSIFEGTKPPSPKQCPGGLVAC